MSHYYENDPHLKSKPNLFDFVYRETSISFVSDSGVFSKSKIDFGTTLLLDSLPRDLNYKKILDLGCGYGPIGLSIAKVYPKASLEMTDVNLRAIALSQKNAERNNIKNVQIYESNLFDNIKSRYDLIITNPPIRAGKIVVHGIIEKSGEYLFPDGELWVVIQKKQGALSLLKKAEEIYFENLVITKVKGYYIIQSKKKRITLD